MINYHAFDESSKIMLLTIMIINIHLDIGVEYWIPLNDSFNDIFACRLLDQP